MNLDPAVTVMAIELGAGCRLVQVRTSALKESNLSTASATPGHTSRFFALRDPDVRLMIRVRADEPGAFEELVARYQHRLLAVMHHLCGHAEEAEDLAQETFLRVYRARKEYHPQAKFSTWLFTIANNLALNSHRRKQRKPTVQLAVHESGPMGPRPAENLLYDRLPGPENRLAHQELAQMIQVALTQLNERQRVAVVLNKFEDMSYQEIAEVMGTSTKAVKSLLSRARLQLKELLQAYVQMTSQGLSLKDLDQAKDAAAKEQV